MDQYGYMDIEINNGGNLAGNITVLYSIKN